MLDIYTEKEFEMAYGFMARHSKEGKVVITDNKRVLYEIFDDILEAEEDVFHIRKQAHDEGKEINMIHERPESNVLLCIFNGILRENGVEFGLAGRSIFMNIADSATDFIEIFMEEVDSLDELTRSAFVFQADDLLHYIQDKVCEIYNNFEILSEVANLDMEVDFEELNELSDRVDNYLILGKGSNPLKTYAGNNKKADRFIELLDMMVSLEN